MSDLEELIKYIEVLEAEPFTWWTGGNKKGYLTACTSIKTKALKLLEHKANGNECTELTLFIDDVHTIKTLKTIALNMGIPYRATNLLENGTKRKRYYK